MWASVRLQTIVCIGYTPVTKPLISANFPSNVLASLDFFVCLFVSFANKFYLLLSKSFYRKGIKGLNNALGIVIKTTKKPPTQIPTSRSEMPCY